MKKTISLFWFIAGIIIWGSIIGFLISIPLAHVLNTEDVISSSIIRGIIQLIIGIVALVASSFVACWRYALPSSTMRISIWVGSVNFVLAMFNLILLPMALGSKNLFAFVSAQALLVQLIGSLVAGVVIYYSLNLFSHHNSQELNTPPV